MFLSTLVVFSDHMLEQFTERKFSSSPLCLVTGGMCESDKNTSLHFIKINKEILTKAPMMFCWDLKWLIQSFPKPRSDQRPCSLLPILTLNNQLTCLQHLSFSEKVINQRCNQLLSKKKRYLSVLKTSDPYNIWLFVRIINDRLDCAIPSLKALY